MDTKIRENIARYILEKQQCDNEMLMSLATGIKLNEYEVETEQKTQFINKTKCKTCVHNQECNIDNNTREACIKNNYDTYHEKN